MRVLEITGDRPLRLRDCQELSRYWHANGWSCVVGYAYTTPGGTKLYSVRASR